MSLVGRLHGEHVHNRRVRLLCESLSDLIPESATLLDVGCGDGLLASLIMDKRQDLEVNGIDVLVRDSTKIPVSEFDGSVIPRASKSVDVVMFVDVLHHTEDPLVLLREATRVARKAVVIKDHLRNGLLAGLTLRFMDFVGNAPHGVALPYNYWPYKKWQKAFDSLDLKVGAWKTDLRLYPSTVDWVFGRSLHFIARLDVKD
jgi:SAM-dependent methyltransferase